MFSVYKPLEESCGIEQVTLSADEEYDLYQKYHKTPVKIRHKFVSGNLNKLNYMSKYMDINWFLPLYLSHNFLAHYLTPEIITNLIHSNHKTQINISNFFSSRFNFNLEKFNSNYKNFFVNFPNSGQVSGERVFAMGFNHVRTNTDEENKYKYSKSNKEFVWADGEIYCTLLNYQRLDWASKFSDLSTFDVEYPEYKHCCYMCKKSHSKKVHFADKQDMCYACGIQNHSYRSYKAPMDSIRAYVSGCRHTVGYSICLEILRNGGFVVGSTRFPKCAQLNYQSEPDYASWAERLVILPCDFTNLNQVYELLAQLPQYKINTFISNAFQTVRQSPEYYSKANKLENQLSQMDKPELTPELGTFMADNKIHINSHKNIGEDRTWKTQWTQNLVQMDTGEILEANMINQIAPTIIFQKILDMWTRTDSSTETNTVEPRYIINVSSTEAFACTDTHIVTSMNKIAMDNLVDRVRIGLPDNFMAYNADPGFVTGVTNDNAKPLDGKDGAIRVLKPLLDKLNGINSNSVPAQLESTFYKDYKLVPKIRYSSKPSNEKEIDL